MTALSPQAPAIWDRLANVGAHPLASAFDAAGGRRVVGLLGGGAPIEVILAAGCTAVAVTPRPGPHPLCAKYLGPGAPLALAGRLERLLAGELTPLAAAVATSRHELDAFLYHAAKAVLGRGEGAMFPALHLHVLLGDPLQAAADYSLGQARRLADRLAAISGESASRDRFLAAIAEVNALRRSLARLQALRVSGQICGVDATIAIAAARSLPPAAARSMLDEALDKAAERPPAAVPRLLLMSSGELYHPELHAALEDAGARVVLEDGDWGARAFGPEITLEPDEPPLEAIVRAYRAHTPGLAVYPHTLRHAWFYDQAARPEVDAVVFHLPLDEAALGWDYPRLRAHVAGIGKPALLLRADPLAPDSRAQITGEARAFLSEMAERRA